MRRGAWAAAAALALAACRAAPRTASAEARARLAVLEDILRSKDDNDPRLDAAFSGLSEEAKLLFRTKYRDLPPESRNQRGTIVYLLGQNAATAADWAFLREAAGEPLCLSLSSCSKPGAAGPGDEVTLAYPALVALKRAEAALEAGEHAAEARAVVAAAKNAGAPAAVRLAERLETRFPR